LEEITVYINAEIICKIIYCIQIYSEHLETYCNTYNITMT